MERSLREALRYRGCLICYVLDKDESDFMAELQYRTIKEEKVRQDVVSSKGYCNFHFHQMARMASPVGNAFLTKELIETEIKGLETGSLTREVDCAVCQYIAEREDFYLEEFKTLLKEKSFQKEYEGSDGLCSLHFRNILNSMYEKELCQFLLTTQVMHLKLLGMELETFISKVRSTSRDMGVEKNSWWIAIEKWVGKKGLRIRSQ
ncbi:MAG: DUF6062 family protein [Thermodesulfobacteriota bacterium]|jgi:hypothetical protein